MPAVFVHGVPDTADMWKPLLAELARDDVVTLSLPGFASPVPNEFGSTKDEYVAWVADQIAALGEPVDLVGHDWGSLLTQRVALTLPELVRSFTLADGAVADNFVWHDLAVQWQTPEVGEQIMEILSGDAATIALRDAGHPDPEEATARIDDTMKRCVLALYRSAIDVVPEWVPRGRAERPGLVLWGSDDPYGPVTYGERIAQTMGAKLVVLDAGHWAPVLRPRETSAALESFWAGLG